MWEQRKLIKLLCNLQKNREYITESDLILNFIIKNKINTKDFFLMEEKIRRTIDLCILDKYIIYYSLTIPFFDVDYDGNGEKDERTYIKVTPKGRRFSKIEWFLNAVLRQFNPLIVFVIVYILGLITKIIFK